MKPKREAGHEEIRFCIRIEFGIISYFGVRCLFPGIQRNNRTNDFKLVFYFKNSSPGRGSNFVTIEVFGVILCDEGKGLFHEATVRGLGSTLREKGVMQNYVLYASWLLKNGDKVFVILTAEGKSGAAREGKATIIGGTGKCADIQGSWEYTGSALRPAAEGIGQGYNKHNIKYKLP